MTSAIDNIIKTITQYLDKPKYTGIPELDERIRIIAQRMIIKVSRELQPLFNPGKIVAQERFTQKPGAGGDRLEPQESTLLKTRARVAIESADERGRGGAKRKPPTPIHERNQVRSLAVGPIPKPPIPKPLAQEKIEMFAHILICKEKEQLLNKIEQTIDSDIGPAIDSYREFLTSRLKASKSDDGVMETRLLERELRLMNHWPKTGPEALTTIGEEYAAQFLLLSTFPENYQKMDQKALLGEIKTIENFYGAIDEEFPVHFNALQNEDFGRVSTPVLREYDVFLTKHAEDPRLEPIISEIRSNPEFSSRLDKKKAIPAVVSLKAPQGNSSASSLQRLSDVAPAKESQGNSSASSLQRLSDVAPAKESQGYTSSPTPTVADDDDDDVDADPVGVGLPPHLHILEGFEAGTVAGLRKSQSHLEQLSRANPKSQVFKDAVERCGKLIDNYRKEEFKVEKKLILKEYEELEASFLKKHPGFVVPAKTAKFIQMLSD